MRENLQGRRILWATVAGCGALSMATVLNAAPAAYQTAVLVHSPYAFYRQSEANGPSAADASGNNHPGTYLGTPTFGVTGVGAGSDNAVAYDGTDNEVLATSIDSFGSLVGNSSYEFVFKTNAGFSPTTIQSLFGIYSVASNLPDVNLDLNSRGNDALGALANTTRIFIRGNNADANGGASWGSHFTNATLYDGNYHHLVFTYDSSQANGADAFKAYVDGVEQTMTFTQVNGTLAPAGFSDFDAPATFAGRNVRTNPITGPGVSREANITIDEAALYGTVLTPAQVAAHAAAMDVPEPTSLALIGLAGVGMIRRTRRGR